MRKIFFGLVAVFLLPGAASGQFFDSFDGNEASPAGWESFTGDGEATIQFIQKQDYASMVVDATKDRRLIWWAVIKREVSEALDLGLLDMDGKGNVPLTPLSPTMFSTRLVNVEFVRDSSGAVTHIVNLGNGGRLTRRR